MNITEFIRESVLRPRLKKVGCMVVYDAEHRYHELCLGLGSDDVLVVDASESSIESREAAIEALRQIGQPKSQVESLLIYVPAKRPETDEQKQIDPFALYAECGSVFPENDGDEYLSLCLRARPDHATKIRQVFADNPSGPAFAVIDAIGGGSNWPQLRGTLKVESAREILAALLAPSAIQTEALKVQENWFHETQDFLKVTLELTLKTRSKTWAAIADELWRFVLFSEFVFDLPVTVTLPETLKGVPHASIEAKPIIEDVCEQLRNGPKTCSIYIDRAECIESELNLPFLCKEIEDLGVRDTFPFEERTFLRTAIKGIITNDTDVTRRILMRHKSSVWLGKGESQAQWELVRTGLALVEACEDYERQLPGHSRSQSELLDFYLGSLREADRFQREFEQAVGDFIDPHGLMNDVIKQARSRYRRLTERVQSVFTKHLETSGWPPSGRLANADAFDRLIVDRLKENGHKVAYLMVDALRYELGVVLEKMLSEDGPVELQAAFAQLPTITTIGMASLLPGAGSNLSLALENDALIPKLAGTPVTNVSQRMDILGKRFGDRFSEMPLNDFVRGKHKIPETVDLLVLRSTEIDSQLESNPETTLSLIPGILKLIRAALHKLRGIGFNGAVIVTDHGFFLNAQAEAGDVCVKPQGNWLVNAHDRMMLGDGVADSHNLVVGAEKVGVHGSFSQIAIPRTMAPYRAGHLYFHGGASLAEAVVPILVIRLDTASEPEFRKVTVEILYKNGAKRIMTRMPVIELSMVTNDIFSQGKSIEILLEAQDKKGNIVGEPRPGGDVDPATRTVVLMSDQRKQIVLRMDPEFEGEFTVKALNPTTLVSYCGLKLETDYTV